MTKETQPFGVLFVCLGNICRSPLAEGVFLDLLEKRGARDRFCVDSCGTGSWHVGAPPDQRSQEVALAHGLTLTSRGRTLEAPRDFERFDLIVPMDRQNKRDLIDAGAPPDRVRLLRSYDPALRNTPEEKLDVPDPYWDEDDGFEAMHRMVHAACLGMIEDLLIDANNNE